MNKHTLSLIRKALFLVILMLAIVVAQAQESPVDRVFEKYANTDGCTSVFISSYMFSMLQNVESDDKELDELIKNLKSIKIITFDNPAKKPRGLNLNTEVMQAVAGHNYRELMKIKEKDQDITFLVKEQGGRIVELLLLIGGSENTLISIQGTIDMKSLGKLSKSMNIQGLDKLDKVK